jgi:hypothetical protein
MAGVRRAVCALKSITGVIVLVLMVCMVTLWLDMRDGNKGQLKVKFNDDAMNIAKRFEDPRRHHQLRNGISKKNANLYKRKWGRGNKVKAGVAGALDNQTGIPSLAPSVQGRGNGVCQHLLSAPFTSGYLSGAPVGKPAAGRSPNSIMPQARTSPCYGYEHLEDLTQTEAHEDRHYQSHVSAPELKAARIVCSAAGLKPCTFYSQMHEDAVLFNMFFKHQLNGVYLELSALDGIKFSNTLFFQQSMNWTGAVQL